MQNGFPKNIALKGFFLAVILVEISNSLKNHDALRESGENFVTSIVVWFYSRKILNSLGKFTIQPLNLRLTILFNSSFAHVQLDSADTNDAIRKRPRSDLSSFHPKVSTINNLLCLFIFLIVVKKNEALFRRGPV